MQLVVRIHAAKISDHRSIISLVELCLTVLEGVTSGLCGALVGTGCCSVALDDHSASNLSGPGRPILEAAV